MERSARSAAEILISSDKTQPDLDLISRINLLSSFSQSGAIIDTIVNAASVHDRHRHSPETWDDLATFLLDSGQVGMAAWLAGQGVNVGGAARAVLEEARPYFNLDRRSMDRADIMSQVISPAILLSDIDRIAVPEDVSDPAAPMLLINATLAAGGAERQFVLLVKSLLEAGLAPERVHVGLFSTAADRGHAHFKPALESLGVTVHDLEARTVIYGALDQEERARLGLMPLRIRADVAPVIDLCRELRPAVIHGWQDRSSIAAGLAGVMAQVNRIVLAARNMQPDRRMLQDRDAFRDIYGMLCKRPNVVMTANSEAGARDYENWIGLERHTITVTSNAIDLSEFPVLAGKPLRGRKRPIVRILGVFRLAANKRPELWMRTVAELRRRGNLEVRPRIVGNGPFLSEIEALREELGLKDLKIESHLSKAEAIYGGADVLLLMSRVEGTPNVVIEAQCCGLAVAACDVGGVREAMMPGNLVLDPDIEAEAAAVEIENWIRSLDTAQRAENVKEVRRKYDISTLAQRALGLYGIQSAGGDI
ncbi:glycosyltransferase [Thioclava sp. FR2]|uniref:glycosyltransferase n=1 Tax=Thioclava sp. FR2 TaxID=3445780 RepID=UPI003EBC5833